MGYAISLIIKIAFIISFGCNKIAVCHFDYRMIFLRGIVSKRMDIFQ